MSKAKKDIDAMGERELADELTLEVGRSLVKVFREGVTVESDGKLLAVTPPAAYLNAARQYIQTVYNITDEEDDDDPFKGVLARHG